MADSGIKQTIIKSSDLPNVLGNDTELKYTLRYRIVSEDKNRFSHWSPIKELTIQNTFEETGFDANDPENTNIPHHISIDSNAHVASISWTMPALLIVNPTEEEKILQAQQAAITEFDVYVQWETDSVLSDWVWVGKSTGTSYSLSYPHGTGSPDHIKFRIQKVTIIKGPFDAATYLISSLTNL
jgi:hypothetical protein